MSTARRITAHISSALAVDLVGVSLPLQAHPAMGASVATRHHTANQRDGSVVRVAIKHFGIHPATFTITHETTVIWGNLDTVAHTVTADDGSFTSARIGPGKSYRHTFLTEGVTEPYHCKIHPFMKGTVIVTG